MDHIEINQAGFSETPNIFADGDHTVVFLGGGDLIYLVNVAVGSLTPSDVILT